MHVLVCRDEAGMKLTVCAGTRGWAGVLTAAELRSMASAVGMDTEEFAKETERALTGRPQGTEKFVYSARYEAERLQLVWKRHLLADNVKVRSTISILANVIFSNVIFGLIFSSNWAVCGLTKSKPALQ